MKIDLTEGKFKSETTFKLDLVKDTGLFGTNAGVFFTSGSFVFDDGAFVFTRITKDGKDDIKGVIGTHTVCADGNGIKLIFDADGKEELLALDPGAGTLIQTVPTPVGDGKLYYTAD